jgi:hypothetical protein
MNDTQLRFKRFTVSLQVFDHLFKEGNGLPGAATLND